MGFKRIVAKSEQDLEGIMSDVKKWFKETPTFDVEITSEKRKFRDPKTEEDFEKDIDVINIIDQTKKDKKKIETTIKFIPLIKAGEMKVEIGGEKESTIVGKIKNQLKSRGVLKSYTKDTKVPLKETITKSKLRQIIREEIHKLI